MVTSHDPLLHTCATVDLERFRHGTPLTEVNDRPVFVCRHYCCYTLRL